MLATVPPGAPACSRLYASDYYHGPIPSQSSALILTCSLPTETAPDNITYHQRPCTSCSSSLIEHCLVTRQPETPSELDRMIVVVAGSCVNAYRYCGTDPEILRRLIEAGCRHHCDALISSPPT